MLSRIYEWYEAQTISDNVVDFSLLQSRAYQFLQENPSASTKFKMIVIDDIRIAIVSKKKFFLS